MIIIVRGRNYFKEHVAHIGDKRESYWVLVRRPDGKRLLARTRHRGNNILKWIFKKRNGRPGLDCCSSG
jgi:hypothetical protein